MSDDAKKMPYNSTYFYHMVKYHYFNDDAKEKLISSTVNTIIQ